MKFVEAELEKTRRCSQKKLKDEFAVFMEMNVKCARAEWSKREYSSPMAARVALREGARRLSLPIKVLMRNGNVYLVRTDL